MELKRHRYIRALYAIGKQRTKGLLRAAEHVREVLFGRCVVGGRGSQVADSGCTELGHGRWQPPAVPVGELSGTEENCLGDGSVSYAAASDVTELGSDRLVIEAVTAEDVAASP